MSRHRKGQIRYLAELGLESWINLIEGTAKSCELFASLFGDDKLSHAVPIYRSRCFEGHINYLLPCSAHFSLLSSEYLSLSQPPNDMLTVKAKRLCISISWALGSDLGGWTLHLSPNNQRITLGPNGWTRWGGFDGSHDWFGLSPVGPRWRIIVKYEELHANWLWLFLYKSIRVCKT